LAEVQIGGDDEDDETYSKGLQMRKLELEEQMLEKEMMQM
jgi:hypothetical protein